MKKTIHSEKVVSDPVHPTLSYPASAGQLGHLARLFGLALYMIDPFRDAFDPALVNEYSSSGSLQRSISP